MAILVCGYRTGPTPTLRSLTIYAISVLAVILYLLAINFAVEPMPARLALYGTGFMLSPLAMMLAELITFPYFNSKNKKFIHAAAKKLADMRIIKIGITGSYGKTSCKNILAKMLSKKYIVSSTPKNYNTAMGIALAIDGLRGDEEIFIAEMGARKRGDIRELADMVKPDYSLTTGVCEQHLKTFKSLHNVFSEKSELSKNTSILSAFNCNDKYVLKMYREFRGRKMKVCCNKKGDVYSDEIMTDARGSRFTLRLKYAVLDIQTCLLGKHNIINITLCAALAETLGVSPEEIKEAVKELRPAPHRLEYAYGNGIHILDDSYNSNPSGVKYALECLGEFEGRKVLLTQGLVEMGRLEKSANETVGFRASSVADVAILVGKNSKAVEAGLKRGEYKGEIYKFRTLKAAEREFANILKIGDVLLIQNDLPDTY